MRRFRFGTEGADPARTLVVDGAADGFRCLSHWPGADVPDCLRHDLSTGMALNWAACSAEQRDELLGPFEWVANTHYDTDGVLSAFAVLQPEQALTRAPALLAAAACGDFCTWQGRPALQLELTLSALPRHPRSPATAHLPAGASDRQRWTASYDWALAALPELLDEPARHQALWAEQEAGLLADLATVDAGQGPRVERLPQLDLAVLHLDRPLAAMALHRAAGALHRLLLIEPADGGHRYRFCYRDESWFRLVTRCALARVPMDGALAELQVLESAAGPVGALRWWCDPLTRPVVELSFGDPSRPRSGFFLDPMPVPGAVSRLAPEVVADLLSRHLSAG